MRKMFVLSFGQESLMKRIVMVLAAAVLSLSQSACGPSEAEKRRSIERRHVECLDMYCEGDLVPAHIGATEFAFKVNGQWFIAPREYGGYGGAFAFLWPSKTPANKEGASKSAPEFVPSSAGVSSNFYDVSIEIFLRSNSARLRGPSRYKALQFAEAKGRVLEKRQLREGLEVWRVQSDIKGLPPDLWYVATALKDADSEPPVLGCEESNPKFDRCTMAFQWRPGIFADLRLRATHGQDWPEIYQEVIRVLNLIRQANQ